MSKKELFFAVYKELPKTVTTIVSVAVAGIIMLACIGIVEFQVFSAERKEVLGRIERYDVQKSEEIKKAQSAEQWAKDCRSANPLGTDTPANSCDVIQSGNMEASQEKQIQEVRVTNYALVKSDGEIVQMKHGGYMNWNVNANNEAQAPMIREWNVVPILCTYCLNEYLDASGFDKRFNLTEGYGATLFKKVGDRYGIKPEVLVCISQADTSLGKHLKTPFNIGNVGNNDHGHVRGFTSIGAGIDAIGAVLSNKYLGHKQSLGSLTPFGGGSSPFYATSPTGNWYNNVRNCLAEIMQDENLGPDFAIRK